MASTILQLNFKLNVSPQEYEQIVTPLADQFAAVNGLQWKIWLMNQAENEAGGIYCFEDERALEAFLTGPLAAEVKKAPFLRDLSAKRFDVMPAISAVTRAPVPSRVST